MDKQMQIGADVQGQKNAGMPSAMSASAENQLKVYNAGSNRMQVLRIHRIHTKVTFFFKLNETRKKIKHIYKYEVI